MPELEQSSSQVWRRAFDQLKSWVRAKPPLLKLSGAILLGAILCAPSVWMLSAIPPLWRDLDAYVQVTHPPGVATILVWGPLYCFAARIPLYLGYARDCLVTGAPFPRLGFFLHPTLTDSGAFLLVLLQHGALGFSSFYLIVSTSRLFLVRLALAILWAANPLFYVFANCVGSETLSMVLVLLLGAIGLRIIQHPRIAPSKEWILFGVLLWLCILTRHMNAVLAAVMPVTFLLLGAYRLIPVPFVKLPLLRRSRWLRASIALRKAGVAFALGAGCIILASASLRGLSKAAHIPYHSTVGFTFLFRLNFLAGLPAEKRNEYLDEMAKRTSSPQVKNVISILRSTVPQGPDWGMRALSKQVQRSASDQKRNLQVAKLCRSLNRMAQAFLSPPSGLFLNAVASDFRKSLESTIPSVVRQLFENTAIHFSRPSFTPDYASLSTFRDSSRARIMAIIDTHSYLRLWANLNYAVFLFLWSINLAFLGVFAKARKVKAASVLSYAAALTLIGLLMMTANCFLNVFQPRYTLPMWELTIVSSAVLLARTMDICFLSTLPDSRARWR